MKSASPTTVVVLTPGGRGAIATIRVEGPQAAESVRRYFVGPAQMVSGRIHVGLWSAAPVNSAADSAPPEEIVVCRLSDEESEIHCHGGLAAPERIVADLLQAGCVELRWQDWIRDQELDPIRAAARELLAVAPTERTAGILLDQYNGALRRAIDQIQAAVKSRDAEIAIRQINELLLRGSVGLHLIEPWRIVLAGPPNAGKSSLINALVGYGRSIVHATPGTTRDAVSVAAALDGWPIELIDTAGLRAADDPLEQAGIARARQQISAAHLVVLLFDVAEAWTDEFAALAADLPHAIAVQNKIDLLADASLESSGIGVSAKTGEGLDNLISHILGRLLLATVTDGDAVPFTIDQIESLRKARSAIDQGGFEIADEALASMLWPLKLFTSLQARAIAMDSLRAGRYFSHLG